ncbi:MULTISPECIES: hypothetical protein [Agrobacterium]|uniref:hypothetical protein n=1 Tax=Agrobacterium TaxID=357 RepID=UPI000F6352C5|nr:MULTISPECIES: hypothetical protein [Agrobacterium]MCZ7496640.1 hypothetical protein [Rhizobium rhizogenes]MBW9072833.1 hypothetical protein [Agrobacterium deltaense]MCZ7501771.1 hypothetical protein [Rhizobium rhizogenes]NTB05183.1 hypothetical protein [Agrobacterium tumefaciens]RRN70718.1 hypothetical protein EIQ31_14560 [Agrobacterium deltaense]
MEEGSLWSGSLINKEAMKAAILQGHVQLGPEKPVSYLPLNTIENMLGLTVDRYREMLRAGGNESMLFEDQQCAINSGAVYGYNVPALGVLLRQFNSILIANGWPDAPEQFVEKIARNWVEDVDAPLLLIIRAAFGDNGD